MRGGYIMAPEKIPYELPAIAFTLEDLPSQTAAWGGGSIFLPESGGVSRPKLKDKTIEK